MDEGNSSQMMVGADSILIRKNRLRRIISSGRISHFTAEGDGHCDTDCPETFVSPICSWNLNEECLLDAFLILFDTASQEQNQDENIQYFRKKFQTVVKEVKEMRVNLNDFQLGRLLFKGSFTSVHVVKEKSNSRILAIKSIDKFHHQVQKSLYLLDAELAIRSKNASQWIVGFSYAFQDPERVHFIMEFMDGGNYLALLERHGGRLNEELSRFYLGELVLAINAIHSIGFAHRSVRPENILFDALGHLKLSGFGSASKITKDGKVSSPLIVNSASYEAPEILRTLGNDTFTYGIACDYWSLGIVAYLTTVGEHPFLSNCQLDTFKKITSTKRKGSMELPPFVNSQLKEFINELLVEQEERINYHDCIRHSFFNSLIWDGIRNEVAPSIPPVVLEENIMDTGNGDYKLEPPTKIRGENRPISNVAFIGFTQTNLENEEICRFDASSILDSTFINEGWKMPAGPVSEDSKLKSELQLKTELLMEKLNEIQILQTQLQKSSDTMNSKDNELSRFRAENKRLGAEIEDLKSQLIFEKESRERFELKLRESVIYNSQEEEEEPDLNLVSYLKESICKLEEDNLAKDDQILELSVQVKILRHDLKLQELENQFLSRRECVLEDTFAKSYRTTLDTLNGRINELEEKLSEEGEKTQEFAERESNMKNFIQLKSAELSDLQKKIEQTILAQNANMEEARKTRRKYAMTIRNLQEALDDALEEFTEMKEKFDLLKSNANATRASV